MSFVSVERMGPVGLVRYDRGAAANALNAAAIEELTGVAHRFRDDRDTQVVVLTGGARIFSAGVDLADPALWAETADPLDQHRALERGKIMCEAWADLPQLTIAAVEGAAIGGGAILSMALDWRVLARSARIKLPEARLGFNFAWGGLPRLVALIGPARAKRALLTDFQMDAEQALAWGFADAVADDGKAVARSLDLAQDVAAVSPLVLRMTKRAIQAQAEQNAWAHADADQFLLCHWLGKTGEGGGGETP